MEEGDNRFGAQHEERRLKFSGRSENESAQPKSVPFGLAGVRKGASVKTMDSVERAIELIEGMEHPEWILRTEVSAYWDSGGELSLLVTNVQREDAPPLDAHRWAARGFAVQDALDAEGIDLYAYMHFTRDNDPHAS